MAEGFLRWFFGLFVGVIAIVAAINIVVDPYAMYWVVDRPGFNNARVRKNARGARANMSVVLRTKTFDDLILGTSRVTPGIDPQSEVFEGKRVYNAGLLGSNMWEISRVAAYASHFQHLEAVIIGLDFVAFSGRRRYGGDYMESAFSGTSLFDIILKRTISWTALKDSIRTIMVNRAGKSGGYNIYGFRDMSGVNDVDHRRLFDLILTENFLVNEETYAGFEYGTDRVAMLKKTIEEFLGDQTRVYLFISPVHARQLEALRVLDLFPAFENWKRDLVGIVDDVNRQNHGSRPVQLWDFSGYNSITTERLPENGSKMRMRWYWESSHYTKEAGDMVLLRLFRPEQARANLPNDFGVEISKENIEAHLALIRKDRDSYWLAQPLEIEEVARLAATTAAKRAGLLKDEKHAVDAHNGARFDRAKGAMGHEGQS